VGVRASALPKPLVPQFHFRPQIELTQVRTVTKTKASFPTEQAALKLLFLANVHITKKGTRPIPNWPLILHQLAIRFEGRFPL
jgi:transposase-like protein